MVAKTCFSVALDEGEYAELLIMVDGSDLARIELRPSAIVDVFNREARQAMELKTLEI